MTILALTEQNRCQTAVINGYRTKIGVLEEMVRALQSENDRLNKENRALKTERKAK